MTETDARQTSPCPRWIKGLLVVSLAANLGIAGLLYGAALRGPEQVRVNKTPDGIVLIARAMPVKYQRQLREALRAQSETMQPDKREITRLRNQLVRALRAEPFDIDKVNRVFAAQRDLLDGILEAGHREIIRQIEMMTPEERKIFARRLLGPKNGNPNGQ